LYFLQLIVVTTSLLNTEFIRRLSHTNKLGFCVIFAVHQVDRLTGPSYTMYRQPAWPCVAIHYNN